MRDCACRPDLAPAPLASQISRQCRSRICMSDSSSLDRESFQKFLANAYSVQQSQVDSQSLSAIVEIQRLIAKGDLDVDGTLHLIVDRTQDVANASGVAIGLLKGDQLVYRAGSGSAATYTGRSSTARLVVPADSKANCEILRVENAETDARIEAAVCRQFGAKSLLILLICHDEAVAGVLEIFFSEAHVFQDREVRTYRLMAGLVGEAMSQAARLQARQRFFNLVVTNVPGPQFELYMLGRRLTALYPQVPLTQNVALGIAIMSYHGRLNFGLLGDFDAMPDLEQVGRDLGAAIDELALAAGVVADGKAAKDAKAEEKAEDKVGNGRPALGIDMPRGRPGARPSSRKPAPRSAG